jgi:hypothetical protein
MKTIEISTPPPSLQEILALARTEAVLIRTSTGEEFVLGSVDDLGVEADLLGKNPEFMQFLRERFSETATIPLEQLLREHE